MSDNVLEYLKPFTINEIDTILNESETEFENGEYLTNEEVFQLR